MNFRTRLAVVVAALAVALPATQAQAITNGRPDGNGHPYTALMQAMNSDGVPIWVCSGSLLSPTLFLTAGHCVDAPAAHVEVWVDTGPIQPDIDYLLALFTDPTFSGSCNASAAFDGYPCHGDAGGAPHPHPDFCEGCGQGLPHEVYRDVGVVTLDHPVPASRVGRYAQLATAGQVDTLANKAPVDLVGYGVSDQADIPGKYFPQPPPFFRWGGAGLRRYAPSELVSGDFAHSDEFMRFSAQGGGTCFGDSGGPDVLGGTDTVVAVNSYVTNANCAGVVYSQRVDIAPVRDWILGFMRP